MLLTIKDWFHEHLLTSEEEEDAEVSLQRAAAVLLCEIMHADHDIDAAEKATILEAMQTFLKMSPADARRLYNEVQEMMQDVLSLQQFTSLLNEHYDDKKKISLLSWLWRVVYADGRMDAYEEHLVRKIADLLYIRHSDYILTRNRVCGES